MVLNIENQINKESFKFLSENILNNDNIDLIEKDTNEIYQIKTSKNQNNKVNSKDETTIRIKKDKCQCNIKEEVISDKEKVKFSPNKIIENFYKVEKYSNIKVVICYEQVFNLKRLKNNYGNFVNLITTFLFTITMIINFFTNICFFIRFH